MRTFYRHKGLRGLLPQLPVTGESSDYGVMVERDRAVLGTLASAAEEAENYTYQAFTSDDTFTVPAGVTSLRVLVVAGGGGGGYAGMGGGGGAGGLVFDPFYAVTPSEEITVTVGDGGVAGTDGSPTGGDGDDSEFGDLTAVGGGGGGTGFENGNGSNGGSGGGAGGSFGTEGTSTQAAGGGENSWYGYGNDGGTSEVFYLHGGQGGGGAGGVGTGGEDGGHPSPGGVGLYQVTIGETTYNFAEMFGEMSPAVGHHVGDEIYFAGGGGGGKYEGDRSPGGYGGGGAGGRFFETNAESGTGGTGGGGGGDGNIGTPGAGGKGIVIIGYASKKGGNHG